MCYTNTLYHTACGCWGRPALHGEPCIRATTQLGYTAGCDDTIDLGVETVGTMCAKCRKAEAMLPLTPPSESGALTPGLENSDGYFGGLKKVDSGASLASMDSERSSVSTGSTLSSSDGIGGPVSVTAQTLLSPNLHWRTFGGSAASAKFKRNVVA